MQARHSFDGGSVDLGSIQPWLQQQGDARRGATAEGSGGRGAQALLSLGRASWSGGIAEAAAQAAAHHPHAVAVVTSGAARGALGKGPGGGQLGSARPSLLAPGSAGGSPPRRPSGAGGAGSVSLGGGSTDGKAGPQALPRIGRPAAAQQQQWRLLDYFLAPSVRKVNAWWCTPGAGRRCCQLRAHQHG